MLAPELVAHHAKLLEQTLSDARAHVSPGRHCHSTLALAVFACHSLGVYTLILLPLLSFSVKMIVSPWATLLGEHAWVAVSHVCPSRVRGCGARRRRRPRRRPPRRNRRRPRRRLPQSLYRNERCSTKRASKRERDASKNATKRRKRRRVNTKFSATNTASVVVVLVDHPPFKHPPRAEIGARQTADSRPILPLIHPEHDRCMRALYSCRSTRVYGRMVRVLY